MCFMHTSSPSFRETKTGGFPSLKLPCLNNMHTKVSKVEYFKLPPVQKKTVSWFVDIARWCALHERGRATIVKGGGRLGRQLSSSVPSPHLGQLTSI